MREKTKTTTQKLNGRDFWAWLPLQSTAESAEGAPTEAAFDATDSWDGPTFEELSTRSTMDMSAMPTRDDWAGAR
jgi:hypothetical protein